MNGFEVFKKYSAVRAHFTSSYDFIKNRGRTKVTVSSWNKRNDKYYFEKIGKRYKDKDISALFISIFLQEPDIWVGDLVKRNHTDVFRAHKARLADLENRIEIDLKNIKRYLDLNQLKMYQLVDGCDKIPEIYRLYRQNKIIPETLILLEDYYEISKDEDIDDPLWRKDYNHLLKYKRLLYKVKWEKYYDLIIKTIIKQS